MTALSPAVESLADKMERLSSRGLRAAITSAIVGSEEFRIAIEAAIDQQLQVRRHRKEYPSQQQQEEPPHPPQPPPPQAPEVRAQDASAIAQHQNGVQPPESDPSAVSETSMQSASLTPLYAILFSDEEDGTDPDTLGAPDMLSERSSTRAASRAVEATAMASSSPQPTSEGQASECGGAAAHPSTGSASNGAACTGASSSTSLNPVATSFRPSGTFGHGGATGFGVGSGVDAGMGSSVGTGVGAGVGTGVGTGVGAGLRAGAPGLVDPFPWQTQVVPGGGYSSGGYSGGGVRGKQVRGSATAMQPPSAQGTHNAMPLHARSRSPRKGTSFSSPLAAGPLGAASEPTSSALGGSFNTSAKISHAAQVASRRAAAAEAAAAAAAAAAGSAKASAAATAATAAAAAHGSGGSTTHPRARSPNMRTLGLGRHGSPTRTGSAGNGMGSSGGGASGSTGGGTVSGTGTGPVRVPPTPEHWLGPGSACAFCGRCFEQVGAGSRAPLQALLAVALSRPHPHRRPSPLWLRCGR